MYYDDQSADTAAVLLILIVSFIAYFVVVAAVYVVFSWFLGRIFAKVGIERWKAWVPFYNSWILLELGGQAGWWALVTFIPLVGIAAAVFLAIAVYNVGLRFQKSAAYVVLYIFLPYVWLGIVAFDRSQWNPQPIPGIVVAPDWALPSPKNLHYVPQARGNQPPPYQPPYQPPTQPPTTPGGPSI